VYTTQIKVRFRNFERFQALRAGKVARVTGGDAPDLLRLLLLR
jgi:hypothetical protein